MKKYALLIALISSPAAAQFDEPDCLKSNIDLWANIYTRYDADTALVLDAGTLDILEVVKDFPLEPKARRAAAREIRARYSEEDQKVKVQTGIKTRFSEGLVRFAKYRKLVMAELEKRGLPLEIAALPHVESSYNPAARSKVGAVGLWQVMPGTARMMGFKPSSLRDPQYNTMVGAAILYNNYESLGSWPLAITAYNHGLHGVQRAVKSVGSSDICKVVSDYKGPRFGVSSKNFYASFLAALRILKQQGLMK